MAQTMKPRKNNNYWKDRQAAAQSRISEKNIKEIEKQLKKYYGTTMEHVINEFIATYNRYLTEIAKGREHSPATLYSLDKYWQMQSQLRKELDKLGDKQIKTMSKIFEMNYFDIYYSIEIEGKEAFNTIDTQTVQAVINSIWVADGKNWSQRVWDSTKKLQNALNENLINIVVAGASTDTLTKELIEQQASQLGKKLEELTKEEFEKAFNRADSVVRTEVAHIQTQAAQQRYKDYGVKEMQVWADYDERRCKLCGKLHKTKVKINEPMPIPAHPRCRCVMLPVIE